MARTQGHDILPKSGDIPDFEKYSFLNFAIEPWDSPWLTHQPLMACMARKFGQKVLFSLREFTKDEVLADLFKQELPKSGTAVVEPGIYQMRPSKFYPRFYSSQWLNDRMLSLRTREIGRFLRDKKWDRRILYIWNPCYADYIGRMGEDLTVFHCHDNYTDFFPVGSKERERVQSQFDRMIAKSDLIFSCSQALYEMILKKRSEGVYLVENAVDIENSTARIVAQNGVPDEMKGIPRPIIGYIGRVNKKVDIRAMIDMALRRSQWSILLMGPRTGWNESRQTTFQEFLKLPNAYYIEGKSASELPRYWNALDVGIMNYVKEGTWVNYGFPLKMFEYFSVGKPVVGTNLPSIRKYSDYLEIVPDGGDWVVSVEKAMSNDGPDGAQRRIDLARQNSWEVRCRFILEKIWEAMGETCGIGEKESVR